LDADRNKVVVITCGSNGIGEGLARHFRTEGAKAIVVADIGGQGAQRVASEIRGFALRVDIAQESQIRQLVDETIVRFEGWTLERIGHASAVRCDYRSEI
jgi:NAD(P)-dependent dehydrogenase (short-subunit alcohol dehydrogenase family)